MKPRERTRSAATVRSPPSSSVARVRRHLFNLVRGLLFASVVLTACAGQDTSESLGAADTPTTDETPEQATVAPATTSTPESTSDGTDESDGDEPRNPPTTETGGLGSDVESSVAPENLECQRIEDFGDDAFDRWVVVNDGVMGGRSIGQLAEAGGGVVRFDGTINTNGGGFSLIRTSSLRGGQSLAESLTDAEYLRLRVRSANGRGYELIAEDTNSPSQIMHFAPIPIDDSGAWAEVVVPLTGLEARAFGNVGIDVAPFDLSAVSSIGVILADGIDGPFSLEVDRIDACSQ